MLANRQETSIAISSKQSSSRYRRLLGFGIKVLIAGALIYYIMSQFLAAEQDFLISQVLRNLWKSSLLIPVLLASISLMILNWALEVVKWKILLAPYDSFSWKTATKGVLSGISIGAFTPNRFGEFIGRVMTLPQKHRINGALLSVVNGMAQSLATATFGILTLVFIMGSFIHEGLGDALALTIRILLLLLLGMGLFLYFRISVVSRLTSRVGFLKRIQSQIESLAELKTETLHRIYALSLLRFLTFIGQYLIVFMVVMSESNTTKVIGATIMTLFSSTVLPFVPVPDILLRESFALSYFNLYDFDPLKVSMVVFMVWSINIALPAIMGSVVLFTVRIFRRKS